MVSPEEALNRGIRLLRSSLQRGRTLLSQVFVSQSKEAAVISLFSSNESIYGTRPASFAASVATQLVIVGVLLALTAVVATHPVIKQRVTELVEPSDYILKPSKTQSGGGGGGGDRDKLQASKGSLPKQSRVQITPPRVIVPPEPPKLAVDPTVVAPDIAKLTAQLGDPKSNLPTLSNGTGDGSGIGSGSGGGVGSGTGPGVGPGWGGGVGGGPYRVGGGVSAPRALFAPDPEYSEEARKAKYQGVCVLQVVVGPDGRPRDIRVFQTLGMGLDEKAVAAVRRWKFDPAQKDGKPVAVLVNIEVTFRLY
jgi:protein TonB